MDRKMEDEAKKRKKMIKALSKSISSPSRNEKFPPPLMRFLRSNVGSKSSRARSRSSPMFMRKKINSAAATAVIETTQEPSSPKVTCIGQVRVRRSSNKKSSKPFTKTASKPKRNNSSSSRTSVVQQTPYWWVPRALCCHHFFPRFHKPRSCCPLFRKWGLFFRFGYCKKVDDTRDDDDDDDDDDTISSSKVESIPRADQNHHFDDSNATSDDIERNVEDDQVIKESKQDVIGSTPPKNALLLTRCRSAPYRSSSLASRFWGSPLKGDDEDSEVKSQVEEQEQEQERPVSSPMCRDEVAEPRLSSQSEDMESSSVDERSKLVAKSIQDSRAIDEGGGAAVHPLVLTRCKSEPATIGARLNPDASQPCPQDNNGD